MNPALLLTQCTLPREIWTTVSNWVPIVMTPNAGELEKEGNRCNL